MNRISVYFLLAILAMFAGMGTRYWLARSPHGPVLPEPILVDLDGHRHTLAEFRGQVVVLNFWATWCPPCREEMPAFVQLQEEFAGRGLQFVGVAMDDATTVKAYLKEHPVNYPVWLGDERTTAWSDSLGNTLSALPFSVVLDRDGQPVHSRIGVFHTEELLKVVTPRLPGGH